MATTTGPPVSMTTSPVARGHFSRPSKSQSYDPLAPLRSNNNIPPPNPHFVFPMRPESPPAAAVTPSQRRPRSAMGMETMGSSFHRASKGQNELPAFSFNPGATLLTPEKNSFLSPPESPMAPQSLTSPPSPRSSPVKPGYRHRRGGSEFVGGSIRGGDSITVLGISPTKSESGFEVPSDIRLPQGPPAGRRGHAHRRSAAISSHDIASIMVPAQTKDHGHSAPVSPATMERPAVQSLQAVFAPPPEDRDITPVATPVAEPAALESGARSRVGFADTVEVIPRPLSVISTDTTMTITAANSHKVTGSMASLSNLTPIDTQVPTTVVTAPAASSATPTTSPTRPPLEHRPSTAGAILDRMSKAQTPTTPVDSASKRRNSIPTLLNLPEDQMAALHNIKSPKRWSFFSLDSHKAHTSGCHTAPSSRKHSTEDASAVVSGDVADMEQVPKAKKGKKSKKNKKKKSKTADKGKGKVWAVPMLGRKSRPQLRKSVSGSSLRLGAPLTTSLQVSSASLEDCFMPGSDLVMDPEIVTTPTTPNIPTIELPDDTPKRNDEDLSFAMIDLDAALGPFNTPLSPNPEWDAAQRAAGNVKRKLHSAQGMKGFSGPGMHYHRRADSAPEMVQFDRSAFGVHRFGSSSTMADVFEEDEEDENAIDSDSSSDGSDDVTPTGHTPIQHVGSVASMATSADDNVPATPSGPRALSMLALPSDASSGFMKPEISSHSLKTELSSEDIIYASRSPAWVSDSPSQAITPSPRRLFVGKDLAPVSVSPLQLPSSGPTPSSVMSFPSPMSPASYDAQCLSTAPSSLNDENTFQSLLCGEPGPEVRISVDIPSLTSTESIGTRDSGVPQSSGSTQPAPVFREQRPVSVSSAFGRRRSSLASLSRLINSSHGERSKLSMETSFSEFTDKKSKSSRAKRISRLVQFWKPKESSH